MFELFIFYFFVLTLFFCVFFVVSGVFISLKTVENKNDQGPGKTRLGATNRKHHSTEIFCLFFWDLEFGQRM